MYRVLSLSSVLLLCVALMACGEQRGGEAEADEKPLAPAGPTPKARGEGRPQALIKTNHGDMLVELFPKEAPKTVQNFLDLAEGRRAWVSTTGKREQKPFFDGLTFHRVIPNFMIQGGDPKGNGSGGPGYAFEDEISARSLGLDKTPAIDPKKYAATGGWHEIVFFADASPRKIRLQSAVLVPIYKELGIPTNGSPEGRRIFQEKKAQFDARIAQVTVKQALEALGHEFQDHLESTRPTRGMLAMANAGPRTNGSQFFVITGDPTYLAGKHTVFGQVIRGLEVADKISRVRSDRSNNKPLKPVIIQSIREVRPNPGDKAKEGAGAPGTAKKDG